MNKLLSLCTLLSLLVFQSSVSAVTVETGYWIAYTLNDDGVPVAGSAFNISSSGAITGKGVQTDGTKLTLSGNVTSSGAFTILQSDGDSTTRIVGVAKSSTEIRGVISSAKTFYAEFVTDEVGGVYHTKKSGRYSTGIVRTNGKTYVVDYHTKKSIALLKGTTDGQNVKVKGYWLEEDEQTKAKATGRASKSRMNLKIEFGEETVRLKMDSVY